MKMADSYWALFRASCRHSRRNGSMLAGRGADQIRRSHRVACRGSGSDNGSTMNRTPGCLLCAAWFRYLEVAVCIVWGSSCCCGASICWSAFAAGKSFTMQPCRFWLVSGCNFRHPPPKVPTTVIDSGALSPFRVFFSPGLDDLRLGSDSAVCRFVCIARREIPSLFAI